MLGERQSPVAAGLALCAAGAGHRVCILLPHWSHTVETHTHLRLGKKGDYDYDSNQACEFHSTGRLVLKQSLLVVFYTQVRGTPQE